MPRRSALILFASALIGLTALAAPAGADGPHARASVVGGQNAPAGAYPWMVALSRGCGGTLIAPDRVLTAGHCVEGLRIADARAYVSAYTRKKGGYRYDGRAVKGVDVATHPGYRTLNDGGPANDVAVIRLSEPITDVVATHPGYRTLNDGGPANDVAVIRLSEPITDVPFVRLATPEDAPLFSAGKVATVIGWGVTRTDLRSAPLARRLRQGGLRILSETGCDRVYGEDKTYNSAVMLCARSKNALRRPNTSPCVGDSGGPLVVGDLQVGIVSFGISCGALNEPTVFSRVSGLRSFIDDAEPVWSPQPLGPATVTGTLRPGRTATCVAPQFRNPVRRIRYRWGINGVLVATGRRVRVTRAARGRILQCRAVAENAGGETPSAASSARRVPRS